MAVIAQPPARLAQSAEREQMEAGDRCGRARRRRSQAAHDIVRSGIGQQPPEPADLAAQRAHRIADAASEREFGQRRRRRRTGKADDDRQVDSRAHRVRRSIPGSARFRSRIASRYRRGYFAARPQFRHAPSALKASAALRNGWPSGWPATLTDAMPCASIRPLAPTSNDDRNGPLAAATSPAISRMRVTPASPHARARKSSSASRDGISRAAICGTGLKPTRRNATDVSILWR